MSTKIVIGLEGEAKGDTALAFARGLANQIGKDCELLVVYVIEWSPFSFQTAEENAQRAKRREEEIATASSRVINPAIDSLKADGISARGIVKHGHPARILDSVAIEESASQIIVGRSSDGGGMRARLMGSTATNLAMGASVPVTVV